MVLEFLLTRVEIDFYNYRINKDLFLSTGLPTALGTAPALNILDFIRGFAKNIFSNILCNDNSDECISICVTCG